MCCVASPPWVSWPRSWKFKHKGERNKLERLHGEIRWIQGIMTPLPEYLCTYCAEGHLCTGWSGQCLHLCTVNSGHKSPVTSRGGSGISLCWYNHPLIRFPLPCHLVGLSFLFLLLFMYIVIVMVHCLYRWVLFAGICFCCFLFNFVFVWHCTALWSALCLNVLYKLNLRTCLPIPDTSVVVLGLLTSWAATYCCSTSDWVRGTSACTTTFLQCAKNVHWNACECNKILIHNPLTFFLTFAMYN